MLISIAVAASLSYKDTLHTFFADGDGLTLIDTNRIQSFRDVLRIFSEPEVNRSVIAERAKFFRPVAMLFFSLDFSLWKLNPTGYHLTNIILHALISILVFVFMRSLMRGRQLTSWLSALIFATHPILIEVVPEIGRRIDMIVTLFLLLSLIFAFTYYSQKTRQKIFLILSLFFYLLSLGSKEVGIILPVLIVGYLMIFVFSEERTPKTRLLKALREAVPYLGVTLVFLAWRTYVVKGIGGYFFKPSEIFERIQTVVEMIVRYITNLLYPLGYFSSLFSPKPGPLEKVLFIFLLISFFLVLLFYRRRLWKLAGSASQRGLRLLTRALVLGSIFSLMVILIYPIIAPSLNDFIERGYNEKGPAFLVEAMKWKNFYPVEYYFSRARDSLITPFLLLLLLSIVLLAAILHRSNLKRFLSSTHQGKSIIFLLIWLFLPLSVYLVTLTFSQWFMYIAVVPFSAILGVLLGAAFQSIRFSRFRLNSSKNGIFLLLAAFSVALLVFSPLIQGSGEWKESGRLNLILLQKLDEAVRDLPGDCTFNFYNIPEGILSYKFKVPHAKSVGYLFDSGIKSWLDLTHPGNRIQVVVHNIYRPPIPPQDLELEVIKKGEKDIIINVRYTF